MRLNLDENFFIEEDALYLAVAFLLPILSGKKEAIDFLSLTRIPYKRLPHSSIEQDIKEILLQLDVATPSIIEEEDFIITKNQKFAIALEKDIQSYIKKFIKNELIHERRNYWPYQDYKDAIFPRLYEDYTQYKKSFIIRSSRDSKEELPFRFIESLLAFEAEGYINILGITVDPDRNGFNQYSVRIEVKSKLINLFSEKQNTSLPFCIEEKTIGYLKFHKNGSKIKMGRVTSEHYRLLRCLIDPFGLARTVDFIFKKITNREKNNDKYLEASDQLRKIVYAKQYLHKIPGFREKLMVNIDRTGKKAWIDWSK